jgi:uncharacterized membrane protein
MSETIRESHVRSILKSFSWRIIATITTIIIAYMYTGKADMALKIGAWEFVIKMGIYYFHERIWQMMPRGTVRSWFKKEEETEGSAPVEKSED